VTSLGGIIDLTVPIAERLPAAWPTHMPFQHKTFNWYEHSQLGHEHRDDRLGPYATRWMAIDEHTGTHVDAPSHFIPPAGSGLPYANEWGDVNIDGIPLEQLVGPAAVIDAPDDPADEGHSPLLEPEHVDAWELEHGRLEPGDIVLLRSSWDTRYRPGVEGDAYARDVVVHGRGAAWPAPSEATIDLLVERGVRCIGTDGPTMGPAQGGQGVHVAALGRGTVFIECLANLDRLPPRGATFVFLPINILHATGAPGRAVAFV